MLVLLNGHEVDFDACVNLMDNDIREDLHREMADNCTEQEFLDAYCEARSNKYGEEFQI